MYRGFIRLWRKIYDNPIATMPAYLSIFLWLSSHANSKEKNVYWNGKEVTIKRGQLITSIRKISLGTGVPRTSVARVIEYLVGAQMLGQSKTSKFSLFTVENYDKYQPERDANGTQTGRKRDASGTQVDTNKNEKNEKKEKNISRESVGKSESLPPIEPLHGSARARDAQTPKQEAIKFFSNPDSRREIVEAFLERGVDPDVLFREIEKFVLYWTEPTGNGKHCRWETERTFEVKRRLITWMQRAAGRQQTRPGQQWHIAK